jgi:hypothetical protein
MSDLQNKIEANQEALVALAESDLRSSKYAKALLESIETQTSYNENEPTENEVSTTENPQNQSDSGVKESVFAY